MVKKNPEMKPIFLFTKPRYPGLQVVNLKVIMPDGRFFDVALDEKQAEELRAELNFHLRQHKERQHGEGAEGQQDL
jgi:hypothetical protein